MRGDDVIRLHNICPHRGNKMLGGRSFVRAVRPCAAASTAGYKLDGSCARPPKDLLSTSMPTLPGAWVQCEVWEGFIFINLNPDNTRVGSRLPRRAGTRQGYPFAGPAGRSIRPNYRNWKVTATGSRRAITAPTARVVIRQPHGRGREVRPAESSPTLAYQLKGPHRMYSFSLRPRRLVLQPIA